MAPKTKIFTLDDGTKVDVPQLSKELGCRESTAYQRLCNYTDPKKVYRPVSHSPAGGRLYTLDDGTQWSAAMVAKEVGIPQSTASTRLSMHSDPRKVLAPPKKKADESQIKSNERFIKNRMYFDPLGHWSLINKFV